MKRDEDLIWEILVDTEACDDEWYELFIENYRDKGAEVIKYHLKLMKDLDLIKCMVASLFDIKYGDKNGVSKLISLTSNGHDFLTKGREKMLNKAASHVLHNA